jgi:hypothetical protein
MFSQFEGDFLGEDAPLGREQDHRADWGAAKNVFYGRENRFGFNYHPTAAAVGGVVGGMVFVGCPISDVVGENFKGFEPLRPFKDAGVEVGVKHLWEERKNVKAHGSILA